MIDGATNNTTTTVNAGNGGSIAVNPNTNQIYVSGDGVTVIDGATNNTTTVNAAEGPIAVNPNTNQIYVANALTSAS